MMREQTGHFQGQGGLKLFYRVWEPEQPQGSILLVHGMNEHSGRYGHVAEYFAGHGLAVFALDHRGYGQSEGTRCHVDRFEDYLSDLRTFADTAQRYGKPIMAGHSLGGLIAFRYAVAYPETIKALVVSSPFFRAKVEPKPIEKALAPLLSLVMPRLQMPSGLSPADVCRDPEVVRAYATDPLVGTKATPRWFTECTRAALACHQGLSAGLEVPALFLHAGDDKLTDPEATRAVYEQVPHSRKRLKLYPGLYHELFNEPERAQVFEDVLNWLREQELVPAL